MKNLQRGFITPLLIVIAVLAIGGGAYYYSKNSKTPQTQENTVVDTTPTQSTQAQLKKYNDPSGLFSFMYPERLSMNKTPDTIRFYDKNSLREGPKSQSAPQPGQLVNPLASEPTYNSTLDIGVDKRPDAISKNEGELKYLGSLPNHSYIKEDVTLGGQKGYKITYNETTAKSVQYFIPLTYNGSTVLFFATIVSRDGSQGWLTEASSAVATLVFDLSKVGQFVQQASNATQDTEVKGLMANLRPGAELYMDSHSDYTGICKAGGSVFLRVLNEIQGKVGNDVKCFDGKNYAVSVKLTTGEFYCVDSSGYLNKSSKAASQNICSK